jgi:hypothetical protein
MVDDRPRPPPMGAEPEAEPNRLAEPVDLEQPPRLPFPVVGIGASAASKRSPTCSR